MSEISFNPTTLLPTAELHQVHSPWNLRKPLFSIQQFGWGEPVRTGTLGSIPIHDRAESSSPVQYHIYYHHTSVPSIDDFFQDNYSRRRGFSNSSTRWWHLLEDTVPNRCYVFMSSLTVTFPVFWPLFIKIGRYTSTILWDDGPKWHLRFPRCNDNHQWWRHPWAGKMFLNFKYKLWVCINII